MVLDIHLYTFISWSLHTNGKEGDALLIIARQPLLCQKFNIWTWKRMEMRDDLLRIIHRVWLRTRSKDSYWDKGIWNRLICHGERDTAPHTCTSHLWPRRIMLAFSLRIFRFFVFPAKFVRYKFVKILFSIHLLVQKSIVNYNSSYLTINE